MAENLHKKDFRIDFELPPMAPFMAETPEEYARSMADFTDAIYEARPSFLCPQLTLEVRQPVYGDIANSVIRICKWGIQSCRLRTVFPDRLDLIDNENCSHILYDYAIGRCIEQETIFARDVIEGDEMLVHTLVLMFEKYRVDTNVLGTANQPAVPAVPTVSIPQRTQVSKARAGGRANPSLRLVVGTGHT